MSLKEIGKGADAIFNKILPKKLLVVAIATLIVMKEIDAPEEYWWILLAYFGVNIGGTLVRNIGQNIGKEK